MPIANAHFFIAVAFLRLCGTGMADEVDNAAANTNTILVPFRDILLQNVFCSFLFVYSTLLLRKNIEKKTFVSTRESALNG
jgi:hypothetical protein